MSDHIMYPLNIKQQNREYLKRKRKKIVVIIFYFIFDKKKVEYNLAYAFTRLRYYFERLSFKYSKLASGNIAAENASKLNEKI